MGSAKPNRFVMFRLRWIDSLFVFSLSVRFGQLLFSALSLYIFCACPAVNKWNTSEVLQWMRFPRPAGNAFVMRARNLLHALHGCRQDGARPVLVFSVCRLFVFRFVFHFVCRFFVCSVLIV